MDRNNNIAHGVILQKSNKCDSAGDVLCQGQRLWELRVCEKDACSYVKRKESYWHDEIKESRRKRDKRPSHLQSSDVHDKQSSTCSTDAPATGNTEFSNMAVHQLRDELKRRNAKGFSKENNFELIKQLQKIYTLPGAPFSINSILEPSNGFWSEGILEWIPWQYNLLCYVGL